MMNLEEILQLIPNEKLPELKEIYKQNWPTNIHIYYFIDNCIKWNLLNLNDKYIQIYCPNGDFQDGTIVAIIEMYCYDILMYTLEPSLNRLKEALRETKLIDYTREPLFNCIRENYYHMIVSVRKELGHTVIFGDPSNVWWLPKEKALKYNYSIPNDLYVAPLNESHAETMNTVWPHRYPGSEKYISKLLELNGGFGLFLKSNHTLCAWVLKNYFNGLGLIQTAEKHKRKGYGTLIVKIFAKYLAEKDQCDMTGLIIRKNNAAREMFTKMGFEELVPVTWMS